MSLIDYSFAWKGFTVTPFHLLNDDRLLEVLRIRNDDRVRGWMDSQSPIDVNDHLSFCRSLSDRKDAVYCVVESEGNIIGAVYLTQINLQRNVSELGLYRNPDFAVKGLGMALMGIIEAISERVGVYTLVLRVRHENARAIALYRKVGYVETKRSETHLQMKKEIQS